MSGRRCLPILAALGLAMAAPLAGQASARPLPAAETGCDHSQPVPADTVHDIDAVDQPVEAERLPLEDMPLRVREVMSGRSVLRFVVEPSGRINRCSIELVEESMPEWTTAVLRELRRARYRPARRGGQPVRQRVYQIFTYHQDGRFLHGR